MRPHASNERGMAMIIALFMMMALSVIGTSLIFVTQTETASSMNYRLMSQARYGAESGIHKAANYLLSTAYTNVAPGTASDALTSYTYTASPVTAGGNPVILSADADVTANSPCTPAQTAFATAGQGTLDVGDTTVSYKSWAKLMSMRQIHDEYDLQDKILQTWLITA